MIVTPVAKHPIALRNSEEFKLTVSPFSQCEALFAAWVAQCFQRCDPSRQNQSGFSR
jgi:hypothetical protein